MTPTKHFTFINGYHAESQRLEQKRSGTQHDILESRGENREPPLKNGMLTQHLAEWLVGSVAEGCIFGYIAPAEEVDIR